MAILREAGRAGECPLLFSTEFSGMDLFDFEMVVTKTATREAGDSIAP